MKTTESAKGQTNRDLFNECLAQEADARANEYGEADHARKAFWHRLRWSWMNKALAIAEGRDPRLEG